MYYRAYERLSGFIYFLCNFTENTFNSSELVTFSVTA